MLPQTGQLKKVTKDMRHERPYFAGGMREVWELEEMKMRVVLLHMNFDSGLALLPLLLVHEEIVGVIPHYGLSWGSFEQSSSSVCNPKVKKKTQVGRLENTKTKLEI